MKRYWSHLGQVPAWARCNFSASSSESQQSESQQQVATESGQAIGATSGNSNTITINSADPEVEEAADSTLENVADTALDDTTETGLGAEEISANEVDEAASTYAQQSELQTEQTAQALQASEDIAANAAPQTAAAQDEIESGVSPLSTVQGSGQMSTGTILLILGAIGLAITLFVNRKSL
jgi:hypothetical protein